LTDRDVLKTGVDHETFPIRFYENRKDEHYWIKFVCPEHLENTFDVYFIDDILWVLDI